MKIDVPIHERFEALAGSHPHRLAAMAGGQSLTYSELNQRANRVAHAILSRPDARRETVAILAGQGLAVLACILGCLKASRIYIPLEPHLTPLLESIQPGLVLSDRPQPSRAFPVLLLDAAALERFPATNPGLGASAGRLACIYYTSGTTGEAKGVADTHRNVMHNIARYTNSLRIGPGDRLSLLQTPAFSGAVSSMFCALLNGAAVFPFNPRQVPPPALARWVRDSQLTMWHSVPSLFRQLCAAGGEFPSVRVIRLEGDGAAVKDAALFRRHFSRNCVLVNGLGLTEAGICRQYFVTHETALTGNLLPVGYPVPDMEIEVLADNGRPVPSGETGEIVIRSRFLAQGYWERPDLTVRAFQDCGGGARIYRTGDLGRMRPDGCLEHLGRRDSRVKVRGQWVDLAGVEALLQQLSGVAECALRLDTRAGAEPRLVAWIVAPAGRRPTIKAIRAFLQGRVEPHQIPAAFVFLEHLPLTANGKVDRHALPLPGRGRPALDTVFIPPRTVAEQRLAAAWREALHLDAVGIDDDFFELGGDSLSAARLGLDFARLVEQPTIRRLARPLDSAGPGRLTCLLRPLNQRPPLFCVPGHTGVLVGYRRLAELLPAGQPAVAFLPPPIASGSPSYSLPELASRYVGELLRIQPEGPVYLTGLCFGGCVAYEMACQLAARGRAVRTLLLLECFNSRWIAAQPVPARLSARLGLAVRRVAYHAAALVRRGPQGGWDHIRQRLAAASRLSGQATETALANRAAEQAWTPKPYSGRVVLLGGAEPRARQFNVRLMGWVGLLEGSAECALLPDRLHGLLAEPAIHEVAGRLARELTRVASTVACVSCLTGAALAT